MSQFPKIWFLHGNHLAEAVEKEYNIVHKYVQSQETISILERNS